MSKFPPATCGVTKHGSWAVTVERDGAVVVTLSSNGYGGRTLMPEDEDAIRLAAEHLLSFIGTRQEPVVEAIRG